MQEKFMKLSVVVRWIIVVVSWLLTLGGFGGCLLAKYYAELPVLEIILTIVGMFLSVVAICLTIVQLTPPVEEKDK